MSKQKEIDHKELKEADAFFAGIGRARRWIEENQRNVLAVVAGLVIVFVAGVSWSAYSSSKANKTAAAFMRATDALDLDSPETAKVALDNVVRQGGSDTYGQLATLYKADLLAEQGSCSDALDGYRDVQNSSRTGFIRQVAAMGSAYCLETLDKPAEALGAYVQAADMEGPYREQALRGQLRAAISSQDQKLAAGAIEQLLEAYPEAPDAEELSQKLAAFAG